MADVHLGFELEEGIDSPLFSRKLISELLSLMEFGDYLIILGDLKHQIIAFESIERKILMNAIKELSENFSEVILIKGNHDGGIEELNPPENFVIMEARGISLGGAFLFHGHSWPSEEIVEKKYAMMAHTHPVVIKFDGAKIRIPVWAILRTNKKGEEKIGRKVVAVMPSFNPHLPGSDILREGFLDVLSKSSLFSKRMRAYSVDGIRVLR